jgi:plasmid maintenance system killer protein
MLRSFACHETEKLFNDGSFRRLPTQIQRVARRKLLGLHQARSLNDLRVPYGNHLEALKDDRKGRTLTHDDIEHYQRTVSALAETRSLLAQIDALIADHGGWPLA